MMSSDHTVHPSSTDTPDHLRVAVSPVSDPVVVLDELASSVDRARRSVAQVGVLLVFSLVAMVVVLVAQVPSGGVVVGALHGAHYIFAGGNLPC